MAHEWSHGHFYWNELMTRDAEKVKKFYGGAIGAGPSSRWQCQTAPTGSRNCKTPMSADCLRSPSPQFDGIPEDWMSYLARQMTSMPRMKNATAAGAKLMRPIFNVPSVGRIAILTSQPPPASAG